MMVDGSGKSGSTKLVLAMSDGTVRRQRQRSPDVAAKRKPACHLVNNRSEHTFQCSLLGPKPAPSLILPTLLNPHLLLPALSAVLLLFSPSLSNPFPLSKLPLMLSGGVNSLALLFVLLG